jgi:hypothetical protein
MAGHLWIILNAFRGVKLQYICSIGLIVIHVQRAVNLQGSSVTPATNLLLKNTKYSGIHVSRNGSQLSAKGKNIGKDIRNGASPVH